MTIAQQIIVEQERLRLLELFVKGGPGSGNFGHAGRPGEVGGSAPGGGNNSGSYATYGEDRIDAETGKRWNTETSDPSLYHPKIRDAYESLPDAIKNEVSPPVVHHSRGDSGAYVMGMIEMDCMSRDAGEVFTHEFGHYFDYTKEEISSSSDFVQAFEDARVIAGTRTEYPQVQSEGRSGWKDAETIGNMTSALTAGRNYYGGHDSGYFSSIEHADRKEAYAIAFAAYQYYSPAFFREFPSMEQYAEKYWD